AAFRRWSSRRTAKRKAAGSSCATDASPRREEIRVVVVEGRRHRAPQLRASVDARAVRRRRTADAALLAAARIVGASEGGGGVPVGGPALRGAGRAAPVLRIRAAGRHPRRPARVAARPRV